MSVMDDSGYKILREWKVGTFSDVIQQEGCTIESPKCSHRDRVCRSCIQYVIGFKTGLNPDGTEQSLMLIALVYIKENINIKIKVKLDIQQNEDDLVNMSCSAVMASNKRTRGWHTYLFFVQRSNVVDPKNDLLWETNTIKLYCRIREEYQPFISGGIYSYAVDSPLIRTVKTVIVPEIETAEDLKVNSDYDKYFFDNKYLSDVTLFVDDALYYGHMAILARKSAVFEAFNSFDIISSQPQNFIFVLNQGTFEECYAILDYMYTGRLEKDKLLLGFMHWTIVKLLGLYDLRMDCINVLRHHLNFDNVYSTYRNFARKYGLTELTEYIKKFIEDNTDYFRNDLDEAYNYLGSRAYRKLGFADIEEEEEMLTKLENMDNFFQCL